MTFGFCAVARYNLGLEEAFVGNHDRALRHYMIAARCGHDASLEMVKKGYMEGVFSKQDFETALRSYQASRDETKTPQRDRANAEEGYWKRVIKNVG